MARPFRGKGSASHTKTLTRAVSARSQLSLSHIGERFGLGWMLLCFFLRAEESKKTPFGSFRKEQILKRIWMRLNGLFLVL